MTPDRASLLRRLRKAIDPRLLPVLLLLVGALVAVPVLLGGGGDATADAVVAPPAATAAPSEAAVPDAVVQLTGTAPRGRRLGKRVNPFKAGKPKSTPGPEASDKADATPAPEGGGSGGGGGDTGGDSAPADPQPTTAPTAAPEPRSSVFDPVVTFGPVGFDVDPEPLRRLAGIPSVRRPALLYMGLGPDRDAAVFLVASGVAVVGGTCWPSAADCKQVALGVGDEVRFTPPGGERAYLRLKAVRERKLPVDAAREAREAEADGGREALRTLLDRVAELRYDAARGTLEALDGRMRSRP